MKLELFCLCMSMPNPICADRQCFPWIILLCGVLRTVIVICICILTYSAMEKNDWVHRRWQKSLPKKWKSESVTPSLFCCNLAEEIKVWRTLTRIFTFLVGIFAIFSELSHFFLLGGTSSILRTLLGGTSKRNTLYMLSETVLFHRNTVWLFLGLAIRRCLLMRIE